MLFVDFLDSLTPTELEKYAEKCGTTPLYLNAHLKSARKEPRKELRNALADNSGGKVSREEILRHFSII